jgi:GT2 family glycosyltransferase
VLLTRLAKVAGVRVVSSPGPFNFSRLINLGRANASGEVLIILNDDVEALSASWLHELVGQANRPEIGCVGALLLYPDGRVQHAGVVLGINGSAGHAFRYASGDDPGDGFRLQVVHEVSAVTGACLAVRACLFDEVGGFAEDLPVALNDIDFCLKVQERGYRNLFTPHARLIHRESSSRGLDVTPTRLRRLSRENAAFHRRWGEVALSDPFYSPHLSLTHKDFRPRAL